MWSCGVHYSILYYYIPEILDNIKLCCIPSYQYCESSKTSKYLVDLVIGDQYDCSVMSPCLLLLKWITGRGPSPASSWQLELEVGGHCRRRRYEQWLSLYRDLRLERSGVWLSSTLSRSGPSNAGLSDFNIVPLCLCRIRNCCWGWKISQLTVQPGDLSRWETSSPPSMTGRFRLSRNQRSLPICSELPETLLLWTSTG